MNQRQIEAISNLRPETIVYLENVSFTNRAYALPGVVEATTSLGEVSGIAQSADIEIDVRELLVQVPDTEERMIVTEQFVVAGGLCDDQDASDPMEEGTGNGAIYHRGRRASGGEERSFYKAIGLDQYGGKDLEADAVMDELGRHVESGICKNRSLMATLSNLLRYQQNEGSWKAVLARVDQAIRSGGWEYATDVLATTFFGFSYWRDVDATWREKLEPLTDLLCEDEAERAWQRAFESGSIGEPLSVVLDIYEHSGISYSIAGGGMQCRWDTTSGGAVWVPDEDAVDNIRSKVLHELGIGQVKWFGACGSETDPINARYSLDRGETWAGNFSTWRQALDAMLVASGRMIDAAEMTRLMNGAAHDYCTSVLTEYNAWRNGEVYGVVVYVIDRTSGERLDKFSDECWGHIGCDYAEDVLEQQMLQTVLQLSEPTH